MKYNDSEEMLSELLLGPNGWSCKGEMHLKKRPGYLAFH